MRWLALAAEESSTYTVGPNIGLVVWTIVGVVLAVLVLTVLVRWARKPR